MKFFLTVFIFSCLQGLAQPGDSAAIHSSAFLMKLVPGDSVIYYQCHVEEGVQQLTTASGQTLTGKPQRYTVTERYVVKLNNGSYSADYYTSSYTNFPNRRFSGLKVREMPYWEFKKEKTIVLNSQDLKVLAALERKGREAMEYDYPITKYTTNQIIIKAKSNFKQLVIEGNYVISKLISK